MRSEKWGLSGCSEVIGRWKPVAIKGDICFLPAMSDRREDPELLPRCSDKAGNQSERLRTAVSVAISADRDVQFLNLSV